MGASRRVYTASLLFFAATPIWALFVHWFEKDLLYALAFTLDLCLVVPVVTERRCSRGRAFAIAAVTMLAILLRKTGLYELTPLLLILVLRLRRENRIRILAAACTAVVLSLCVNSVLYPALDIEKASVREALSIPFQQTARYVNQFPDEVTPEEREAIDGVLVYDELDEYYPRVSDRIKINYRENGAALPAYFKVWFQMLLKHPVCYFEAGFMKSYATLAPVEPLLDAYILTDYYDSLEQMGVSRAFGDFPTRAFDSLRQMFIRFPLTNMLCMAGTYTWMLLACMVQLLRRRKFDALLLTLPGFMNVLVCVASPLYGSTRYELPVLATIPLIIALTIVFSKEKAEDEGE